MTTATVSDLSLEFRAISEPQPGARMREVFDAHWPAYRRWLLKRPDAGPSAEECAAQLRKHMPELVPIYESLLEIVGGDDERSRFLSLYSPTPIVRGCSQAICAGESGPVLVRNYDHAPHLCDGIVLYTQWSGVGAHVLTDCLWGALDGVNDAGLIVALAFGGRQAVGAGFAASLIVRYLLQTCDRVKDARRALARLPVYMAYNFAMLDRTGDHVVAYTGPDRTAEFDRSEISTNHQSRIEWPDYARFVQTQERFEQLHALTANRCDRATIVASLLRPPLFRFEYRRGSGTLYTVAYDPQSTDISLYWQDVEATVSPAQAHPTSVRVTYPAA